MSFKNARNLLIDRLEQGDRGDRGWFVITRVHVDLSWLKEIATFLENRGKGSPIQLTVHDYRKLGAIIESDSKNPSVQLRRHHLLVMDKPLQLIRRNKAPSWSSLELTERGRELAHSSDPAEVLEQSLHEMRFAVEPWSPVKRVKQYTDFDIHVYSATLNTLEKCHGYIDRDEFDFFLSRVRHASEISWAIDCILEYRGLTSKDQEKLHAEVKGRIPGQKTYQNWRDTALHTFSLFALGTSMIREGRKLLQTGHWVGTHSSMPAPSKAGLAPLRIPTPVEAPELLAPPISPASNVGAAAESFVAKVLRSQGWTVAFYSNRRGYGFDLWARQGDLAMVVEVKSSLGKLGGISLTVNEYRAAIEHGENFVLALVENIGSDAPTLLMIQDPIAKLTIENQQSTTYVVSAAEWRSVTEVNS